MTNSQQYPPENHLITFFMNLIEPRSSHTCSNPYDTRMYVPGDILPFLSFPPACPASPTNDQYKMESR